MYIITAPRMTSGDVLKYLKGIFHSETLDAILPTLNAVPSDNAVPVT